MRWSDVFKSLRPMAMAVAACLLVGMAAQANLVISEVASWSSGNSPLGVDWFELTNTGISAIDITGWSVDDNSNDFGVARALTGISSIAAGESVIFMETDDLAATSAAFRALWFGGSPPAGLQFGAYMGSGIGLSSGGDELHIFNGSGVVQSEVSFGNSPGAAPFTTFDNKTGMSGVIPPLTTFSAAGVRGAFVAANSPDEIGSPGVFVQVPEPATVGLLILGLAFSSLALFNRRKS